MSDSFSGTDHTKNENAYVILEVDPTCTNDVLKASYKRLILAHHPDKSGKADQFQRVQTAWKLVSTQEERKKYDMTFDSGLYGSSESLTIKDFQTSSGGETLQRSCRCGDFYVVNHDDLLM